MVFETAKKPIPRAGPGVKVNMATAKLSQRDIAAITTYFTQAESDAGMRSMHGAFVAMAMSGVMGSGGTKDHEAWVTDFRFGRGLTAKWSRIGRSRIVWNALRKVSEQPHGAQHIMVLFAAHGGLDWAGILTRAFDSVTSQRVVASVGYVGVALLTKRLHDAYQREQQGKVEHPIGSTLCEGRPQRIRRATVLGVLERDDYTVTDVTQKLPRVVLALFEPKDAPKRGSVTKEDARRRARAAWNNEGGHLVRLVKDKNLSALQEIKKEAAAMLAAASIAFTEAMPVAVDEARKPKRRRSPPTADTYASEVLS